MAETVDTASLRRLVEEARDDRTLLAQASHLEAVLQVIEHLDKGRLRVAEPGPDGWIVQAWVKEAVLLYFAVAGLKEESAGPLRFHDRIPVKTGLAEARVRVVPPGTVRYGAHVEPGAVIMPAFVNIGARVGSGTMVDTWATVGSCAQIGRDVHLAGGVGIGGVLEPVGAVPVVVEDGAFVGSRCIVVEGVRVGREAVLGAGTVLTASTPIIDVTGSQEVVHRGHVPDRSVVVPGMRPKTFPAGEYLLPCALVIGRRTESTDRKTSLNAALRDFQVAI